MSDTHSAATPSRLVSILGSESSGVAELLGLPSAGDRLVTATVTATTSDMALVSFTRPGGQPGEGLLPISEFYPNKRWQVGSQYTLQQLDESQRPMFSAIRPEMLELLLCGLSPEVRGGAVRVMRAARVVGIRSKVAVAATEPSVDPVASCLGRQANRVSWMRTQLQGERVDVVAYAEDPAVFVRNVFSPATVLECTVSDGRAEVVVPAHQHAAAMGGGGLNQLLASRLTGLQVFLRAD
jgi:transcription termination/antitermination protein NusA